MARAEAHGVTSSSADEWRKTTLSRALERAPQRGALFETTSHIQQQIAYTSDDLAAAGWD